MAAAAESVFSIQFSDEDIRTSAGTNGYQKGQTYYRQGRVSEGRVDAALLEAKVTGSSEYRTGLTVQNGRLVPHCSCPASKRKHAYCSHVAALMIAWLQKPESFSVPPPGAHSLDEIKAQLAPAKTRQKRATITRSELVSNGLDTLESLLTDLSGGGLTAMTGRQLQTLADLEATVRAQKLHRLARLIQHLHIQIEGVLEKQGTTRAAQYADTLCDLWFTAQATRRHLAAGAFEPGAAAEGIDRRALEELVGHVWREADLDPLEARRLIELGYESYDTDTGFHWTVSLLIDPGSGELFQQRESMRSVDFRGGAARLPYPAPLQLRAGLRYPGDSPQRIKVLDYELDARWTLYDLVQVLQHADTSVEKLMQRYAALLADPLHEPLLYALIRPHQISVVAKRAEAKAKESGTGAAKKPATQTRLLLQDERGGVLPVARSAPPAFHQAVASGLIDAVFGKIIPVEGEGAAVAFYPLSIIRSTLPQASQGLVLASPFIQLVG